MFSGAPSQHELELAASGGQVARVEEGPAQGHARRWIVRVRREAGAGHPDGLHELAVLAQLLGELAEQPGARLPVQALAELVDAGVGHWRQASTGWARGPRWAAWERAPVGRPRAAMGLGHDA